MNIEDNTVEAEVTNPGETEIEWPTDHDVEETEVADETTEEETTDDPQTEEVEGEESTEEESEESEETTEEETEETETVLLEDLEIKVLGETKLLKDIPRDELQSIARKGTDYDRVKGKLDVAQDEVNEWREISEMFEMSPQEVRDTLKEQKFKELAGDTRDVNDVRREYEADRKSTNDKMYERFVEKYPDVKTDELPTDVIDAVKSGQDLVSVYDEHMRKSESTTKDTELSALKKEMAELKAQLGVKKQNTKSKKKGVIKKTSGNDTNTSNDDFLDGLNGDY